MKRRNFVIGLGALSAGGTAALGTGAFSSVEADRDISVEIAEDADGYLAFESSGEYATVDDDGVLELDFGDLDNLGDGVGEDSTYYFGSHQDEGPKDEVFAVRNQGTQDVEITPGWQLLEFDEDGNALDNEDKPFDPDNPDDFFADETELAMTVQATASYIIEDPDDGFVTEVGEAKGFWVRIWTWDNPPGSVDATFEINANEV